MRTAIITRLYPTSGLGIDGMGGSGPVMDYPISRAIPLGF